jgi:hypothetical protein
MTSLLLFLYLYSNDDGSHKHGVECKSSISLSVISVVHVFTAEARKVRWCCCLETRPRYELLCNTVVVNPICWDSRSMNLSYSATVPIHCNNVSGLMRNSPDPLPQQWVRVCTSLKNYNDRNQFCLWSTHPRPSLDRVFRVVSHVKQ